MFLFFSNMIKLGVMESAPQIFTFKQSWFRKENSFTTFQLFHQILSEY